MTLADYRGHRAAEEEAETVRAGSVDAIRHPGPLEYAQIGGVLAVITIAEVAFYYMGLPHGLLVGELIATSAVKFGLVVLWFMHLRFDNRLFSSMFLLGLLLAFSIFVVALATIGGKLV